MGKVSSSARIVSLKLVYFGAPGVGKSTNLEKLRARASDARQGDLITLEHEGDRTLMFDWMPVRAGNGSAYDVRLQVYAVPGTPRHEGTKRRALRDVDGIVFVLDSGPDKLAENRAAWAELAEHLTALGTSRDRVPLVIQLNKRDLSNAMVGDDLRARLGMGGFPVAEAVAKGAAGVGATLLDISKRALRTLSDPARGGGEALEPAEIARIDGTALPEAFAACGLMPKRNRPTPGPLAAEEVQVFTKHRNHDSPPPPSKDLPTQKLKAATLVATLSREILGPGSNRSGERRTETALLDALPSVPAREPKSSPDLPLVEAPRTPSPRAPATPAPDRGSDRGSDRTGDRVPDESERVLRKDGPKNETPTLSPPPPPPEEVPSIAPGELRALVLESEARVMAKLTQVDEQIAELRGLLMNVAEQVRRVSTAPPESEQRVARLVRDALGQMELSATLKAK